MPIKLLFFNFLIAFIRKIFLKRSNINKLTIFADAFYANKQVTGAIFSAKINMGSFLHPSILSQNLQMHCSVWKGIFMPLSEIGILPQSFCLNLPLRSQLHRYFSIQPDAGTFFAAMSTILNAIFSRRCCWPMYEQGRCV